MRVLLTTVFLGCTPPKALSFSFADTAGADGEESTQTSPNDTATTESNTDRVPEIVPDLVLELDEVFQPNDANIWNGFASLSGRFAFTTMSQGSLTLRHYDANFNRLHSPTVIASLDDLMGFGIIADHAVTQVGEDIYVAFSDSGADDLYLLKTDAYGEREAFVALEVDGIHRTNDMHIVSDGQQICVRYGRDGAEKTVQCRTLDLEIETLNTIVPTPVFTGNLGTTVFHDGGFCSFGGALLPSGDVGLELMMMRYSTNWAVLEPFEVPVAPSQNGEWRWASSGAAWIEEHGIWAIAYTTMPSDGQADFDSRGILALYTRDFQLINQVGFGGQAVHRPHLLWRSPHLFLGYDAGPVTLRRYQITSR